METHRLAEVKIGLLEGHTTTYVSATGPWWELWWFHLFLLGLLLPSLFFSDSLCFSPQTLQSAYSQRFLFSSVSLAHLKFRFTLFSLKMAGLFYLNRSFKGFILHNEMLPWEERWLNEQPLSPLEKKQINVRGATLRKYWVISSFIWSIFISWFLWLDYSHINGLEHEARAVLYVNC